MLEAAHSGCEEVWSTHSNESVCVCMCEVCECVCVSVCVCVCVVYVKCSNHSCLFPDICRTYLDYLREGQERLVNILDLFILLCGDADIIKRHVDLVMVIASQLL